MKVLLCLPIALLAFTTTATAGPFGLSMGQSLDSLDVDIPSSTPDDFFYRLKTVPKPHSSFDVYFATLTPGQGICRVLAFTPNTENDRFGTGAKDRFDKISDQLTNVYGESEFFDQLKPGSIWDEPGYWAMSVYTHDRSYVEYWTGSTGAVFKDDITSVMLKANAMRTEATFLALEYQFENFTDCVDEMDAKDENAL